MTECICCHLPKFVPPASATDKRPHVCPDCERHYGSTTSKTAVREAEHLAAWEKYFQSTRRHFLSEIEKLSSRAVDAETLAEDYRVALQDATRTISDGYAKADVGEELRKYIETDLVNNERQRRMNAHRALARANNALLDVGAIHEDHSGKCKCGKPAGRCEELKALAPVEKSLYEWEARQIQRMKQDLDHELRADHPAAASSRLWWRGLAAREDRRPSRSMR